MYDLIYSKKKFEASKKNPAAKGLIHDSYNCTKSLYSIPFCLNNSNSYLIPIKL